MIQFESVGKTFRDGTSAVVDLDLAVPSGKITVIVGPSGCGKTTTLRMVNRMLEPTKGRILWDGTPIKSRRKTTLRRQMGYVIQSGGLFPHRTVVDNIGTVPGLLGWNRQKIHSRSMDLLGSVGLDKKLANRYPAQLSGGQQQRVGVARALAADPLVMLMDEPFSAVDPVVRSELHEFFLGLQRELSKTIILITHDIDEAIKLGDQVAILRVGGKLAQAGTPQEVLEQPADAFVEGFVGRDRGYRSLSFLPAAGLTLERVAAVREAAGATGDQPSLVIDSAAKPLGWVDPKQPERTAALGSTFDPEKDTLRTALDAALTSPVGLAVAVGGDGRYAGVVSAASILEQVAQTRTGGPDLASRPEPVEPRPESVEGPVTSTSEVDQESEHRPEGKEPQAVAAHGSSVLSEDESSRPEPVEGPMAGSPEALAQPDQTSRPEPVEGPVAASPEALGEPDQTSRPEPVEGQVAASPEVPAEPEFSDRPSPEPVEGSGHEATSSEPEDTAPAAISDDPGQPHQPAPEPDQQQR